jgi:Arc/MetJ family transcription regulator
MYRYGTVGCMKKTLHIDEKVLREAKEACGAATDTETVRLGLESLIRHAAYQRLRKLRGTEKSAADVPRRKAEASKKRTAA